MTVLLALRNQAGDLLSKCDEKCYNGKGGSCVCCCGGRNHGVGFDQAVRNLKDFELAAQIPYLPYDHPRQTFLSVPMKFLRLKQLMFFQESCREPNS